MTSGPSARLLEVQNLVQRYKVRGREFDAVAGVSFGIAPGETLGLVGESGSGKSTVGRTLLQLPRPSAGTVIFDGVDLASISPKEMLAYRSRIQMILQDSSSALNPRRRVRELVAEGLRIAHVDRREADRRVEEVLDLVGLDPVVVGRRLPRELSGGQAQRVAIARSVAVRPDLLVCDEPVASLDVSIQGQILNLLERMRVEFGLAMLFISHDLSVVRNVSDRIAVMYLGQLVETGNAVEITEAPAHPYTRALINSVPVADPTAALAEVQLHGEIPSPLAPPSGCRFRTRCAFAQDVCAAEIPPTRVLSTTHVVSCHFPLDATPCSGKGAGTESSLVAHEGTP